MKMVKRPAVTRLEMKDMCRSRRYVVDETRENAVLKDSDFRVKH